MDTKQYIKDNEGLRLKPYKCTVGKLTIGYGRNLDDRGISDKECKLFFGEVLLPKVAIDRVCEGITQEQADIMFNVDFDNCLQICKHYFKDFELLNDNQQTALLDMAFNLGISRLGGFKNMIKAVNTGDFELASVEMLDSRYANQVKNRARRNADLIKD